MTFFSSGLCVTATARNTDNVHGHSVTGGITVLNEIQPPHAPTPSSPTAFPLWKLLQVAVINSSGDREVYMTRNTLGEERRRSRRSGGEERRGGWRTVTERDGGGEVKE